jgi:NitT/TauT family transport system substrate-binding protein
LAEVGAGVAGELLLLVGELDENVDPSSTLQVANALIKADNPKMSDAQIAFALEQLGALKVLDGGDAASMGIGIMTETRWKATYEFMVAAGLLKPEVDWKAAFTDRFVKSLKLFM